MLSAGHQSGDQSGSGMLSGSASPGVARVADQLSKLDDYQSDDDKPSNMGVDMHHRFWYHFPDINKGATLSAANAAATHVSRSDIDSSCKTAATAAAGSKALVVASTSPASATSSSSSQSNGSVESSNHGEDLATATVTATVSAAAGAQTTQAHPPTPAGNQQDGWITPNLTHPNADDEEKLMMEPYEYLCEAKGKNVRNIIIDAFNQWLGVAKGPLDSVKAVIERLHQASLMIDDIEDHSELRRGRPCVHVVFGEPLTINCANYCYFQALSMCRKLSPAATDIFCDEMLNAHRGQGLDLYWRERSICPTLNAYRMMVMNKTGALFRMAIRFMQTFSKSKADYLNLANNLGLFFQIRDDYLNLQNSVNKSFCEDITEGKFSFPIIHCILKRWGDNRLLNILKLKTESVALRTYAMEFIQQTGSLDYCRHVLRELRELMLEEITTLGGNKTLVALIEQLSEG